MSGPCRPRFVTYLFDGRCERAIAFAEDGLYDPHAFVPERFLHEGDNACLDPIAYAFGFARR